MIEACPVCDTLWRLYGRAADNLRDLVARHGESRAQGDQKTVEILSHEITISESSLRAVRRELRRHEAARHGDRRKNQESQPQEKQQQNQKK